MRRGDCRNYCGGRVEGIGDGGVGEGFGFNCGRWRDGERRHTTVIE